MLSRSLIARQLAAALLAGTWATRPMEARAAAFLGPTTRRWQQRLIEDVLRDDTTGYPPSSATLAEMLLRSGHFDRAVAVTIRQDAPPPLVLDPPAFAPAPPFRAMRAPRLETVGDLAKWLGVPLARLDWFADKMRQHDRTDVPVLLNYTYRFAAKKSGGPPRLIEAPKDRLKALQRRILTDILDLAPVHPSAHGFVRGRSCLSGAHVHAAEHIVVCADLRDFFPNIRATRIHGLFRSFGYPPAVARSLTGLCTTATPPSVFNRVSGGPSHDWITRKMFGAPHLPQGAPTSPALANLCAWRFDQRCARLASALGGRYTRYADDVTFSGDAAFAKRTSMLIKTIAEIATEEGFAINAKKTRVMRRSQPQRVTGVVVNEHLNMERGAYDTLKAVLHNCRTQGPESQNRDGVKNYRAHMDGRVGWVEQVNPARGAKLRAAFEAIRWPER